MTCKLSALLGLVLLLPAAAGAGSYRHSLEQAAVDLKSASFMTRITNVAVCDITAAAGGRYELSGILEDGLSNALIRAGRFNVIMKKRQEAAMKEIKFGMDGYTDQMKAKKPGQMDQADALLTGTYRRHRGAITVDLQLVTVETSVAVWSGTLELSVSDFPKGSVPEEEVPEVVTVIQEKIVYVAAPENPVYKPKPPLDTSRYTDNGMYSRRPEPEYNEYGVLINQGYKQPENLFQ